LISKLEFVVSGFSLTQSTKRVTGYLPDINGQFARLSAAGFLLLKLPHKMQFILTDFYLIAEISGKP